MEFVKYPRTNHIEGSKFTEPPGQLDKVRLSSVKGQFLVLEEKMDGSQVGIGFDQSKRLQLQSRGHLIDQLKRPEFDLLKKWCGMHYQMLWELLGVRYLLFGEWLFAKHSIFYDQLPDYLMEYDIYDRTSGYFLSTSSRQKLLKNVEAISSVRVINTGSFETALELYQVVGQSTFISNSAKHLLATQANQHGVPESHAIAQTDLTGKMEGLYIKVEDQEKVIGRFKFVRQEFLSKIKTQNEHWSNRPIIPNLTTRR